MEATAVNLLTPEAVARQLSMSLSWVYTHKHQIGYVKFGKSIRFEPDAVAAYASACQRSPEHEGNRWESQSDTAKHAGNGSLPKRIRVSDINQRLTGLEKAKGKRESMPQRAKQH